MFEKISNKKNTVLNFIYVIKFNLVFCQKKKFNLVWIKNNTISIRFEWFYKKIPKKTYDKIWFYTVFYFSKISIQFLLVFLVVYNDW
jgi:hypothetical protein